MQPYQQASREIVRQKEFPSQVVKGAASTGLSIAGIAGTGAVLKRVLPLLSGLIPASLAVKGLEKIDSRFGKFFQGAMNTGNTQEDALNFIREKMDEVSNPGKKKALSKFNEHKKKSGLVDDLHKRYQEVYDQGDQTQGAQPMQVQQPNAPQQPQQQQQGGNTDEMLLAALQKILQM